MEYCCADAMEILLGFLIVAALLWLVRRVRFLTQVVQQVEFLRRDVDRLELQLRNVPRPVAGTVARPAASAQPEPPPIPPEATHTAQPALGPYVSAAATPAVAAVPQAQPFPESAYPPATAAPRATQTAPPYQKQPTFTPAEPARRISLEERLGHNWLNKLGIVTLILGVVLFLGYQLRTLGPAGKSAVGLAVSLLLLGGSILLERRERYRVFARAGVGGGWALLFFVTFALYHVDATRILHSQGVDLVLMMLVAAGMVLHSLRYRSQVVTALAFLLAFLTVGISHVTLFSLLAGALLAAGLVMVAAREAWFALGLAGLLGAYLNHFLWLTRVLPSGASPAHPLPQFAASAALLLFYWLAFRALYLWCVPITPQQQTLSSATALLNTLCLLAELKFQSSHPQWAFYGLLALGAAEMVLAFLGRRRWRGSFIVLSTIASVLLLAAIPFRFAHAPWTLLWLLQAAMLVFTGVRMRESIFRRLGLLASLAAALQALFANLPPLVALRLDHADPSHHPGATLAFAAAALVLWLHGEFVPRRWPEQFLARFESITASFCSYAATVLLGAALYAALPAAWTAVAWLAAAVLLGLAADRLNSSRLAAQTDALTAAAFLRLLLVNFGLTATFGSFSLRAITVTIAVVLLYGCARRRTRATGLPFLPIAPANTTIAALLVAGLCWYELRPVSVAVAWAAYGLVLFEAGATLRKRYLRWQGYALIAASFLRMFFANFGSGTATGTHLLGPRVYTVVPLAAAFLWIYWRSRSLDPYERVDDFAGKAAAWMGTIAAAALLYFEVAPMLVLDAWAVLAVLLLLAALLLRETMFTQQALVILFAVATRAAFFNLLTAPPLARSLLNSRTATTAAACAIALLALPLCYRLRRIERDANTPAGLWYRWPAVHPEQLFFFVPYALAIALLSVVLRAGMITVGWIALGLAAFLFALAVGERSFRLAGLALLLLGLLKIIAVDVWHASPTDRYLTLIVTGAALLLVSFLYSRYRETILKLL